jgi:hypothetical protein
MSGSAHGVARRYMSLSTIIGAPLLGWSPVSPRTQGSAPDGKRPSCAFPTQRRTLAGIQCRGRRASVPGAVPSQGGGTAPRSARSPKVGRITTQTHRPGLSRHPPPRPLLGHFLGRKCLIFLDWWRVRFPRPLGCQVRSNRGICLSTDSAVWSGDVCRRVSV